MGRARVSHGVPVGKYLIYHACQWRGRREGGPGGKGGRECPGTSEAAAAGLCAKRPRSGPSGGADVPGSAMASAEFCFFLAAGERITGQPACIASPIARPRRFRRCWSDRDTFVFPPSFVVGARCVLCHPVRLRVRPAYYARGKGWLACASGRLGETPPLQPASAYVAAGRCPRRRREQRSFRPRVSVPPA